MSDWTGRWNARIDTPMAKIELVFDLQEHDGAVTGTATGEQGPVDLFDGTAAGDGGAWKFRVTRPMPLTFAVTATKDGDVLSGRAKPGSFPAVKMTGSRAG